MLFQLLFPSDQIRHSQLQLQQALRVICVATKKKREEGSENGILLNLCPILLYVPRGQRHSRYLELFFNLLRIGQLIITVTSAYFRHQITSASITTLPLQIYSTARSHRAAILVSSMDSTLQAFKHNLVVRPGRWGGGGDDDTPMTHVRVLGNARKARLSSGHWPRGSAAAGWLGGRETHSPAGPPAVRGPAPTAVRGPAPTAVRGPAPTAAVAVRRCSAWETMGLLDQWAGNGWRSPAKSMAMLLLARPLGCHPSEPSQMGQLQF